VIRGSIKHDLKQKFMWVRERFIFLLIWLLPPLSMNALIYWTLPFLNSWLRPCQLYMTLQPSEQSIPYIKYADDTSFIITAKSHDRAFDATIREINYIDSWCKDHNMQLNKNKTRILLFSSNMIYNQFAQTSIISPYLTKEIKFLGYVLSSNLKWTNHIDQAISKLSSRLHILRILKNTLCKKDLIIIYFAYFQSILDYNFPIINSFSSKDKSRIRVVINRAHRIICGPTCSDTCLPDFEEKSDYLMKKHFEDIYNNPSHILYQLLPKKSHRSKRFILPTITSNRLMNTYIISNAIAYNNNI
jgi:Reverse transcriptase (RNA-dependent DNA polymerase)